MDRKVVLLLSYRELGAIQIIPNYLNVPLMQWFPTFFCSRHSHLVFKIFGGTPGLFIRYKYQGKVTIGGTLGTSSRHPGWEPLP